MTIDFRGDGFDRKFVNTSSGGYYIAYGWQPGVLKVTKTSTFGDVPPCKKGQVSTKANPCAST